MRLSLIPHPQTPSLSVRRIDVAVERLAEAGPARNGLSLGYRAEGAIGDVLVPRRVQPRRRDGLWRHTCFEGFVRERGRPFYLEFNFSPSREWAAYRFDDYRLGMDDAEAEPSVVVRANAGLLELEATVTPHLDPDAAWEIALSAVIEQKDGSKSYWALAHPPGNPDFHHPDCFTLELPPPA